MDGVGLSSGAVSDAREKIFIVGPGVSTPDRASPGFEWVNKPPRREGSLRGLPEGPLPDPGSRVLGVGSGFPEGMPKPIIIIDKKFGRRLPLNDFEPAPGEFWLLSSEAKLLLEEVDGEAFDFLRWKFGPKPNAPARWLCDMVRYLDAIDEAKSQLWVRVYDDGRRFVQIDDAKKTHFARKVIGSARIFRTPYNPFDCFCDAQFREVVRASGFRVAGLQ